MTDKTYSDKFSKLSEKDKFEYKVWDTDIKKDGTLTKEQLKMLGLEGWELCCFNLRGQYVFKQKIIN